MTWVYNGDLAKPIEDSASFKDAAGTSYPGNWDKPSVSGMVKVAETAKPDVTLNNVTGSHVELIDSVPTRVWDSTPRPAAEIKANANAPILSQIVAKERLTDRRVRELVLRLAVSAFAAGDVDRVALKAREDEFAALRATLQS